MLGAVAVGGALGALGRYGLASAWPHAAHRFPWSTFVINASGCLLIGILMVLITEVWSAHRLIRPFLGVGVLGGYTTFSTYTGDVQQLVSSGAAGTGLLYLVGTPVAALAAVYLGVALTRLVTRRPRRRQEDRIRRFLPQLDELVADGLVILDPVEVIRYVGRAEETTS